MNAISTQNLTKYYGKSRGVTDLNLSVEEGDFFGFIGPNGAGKSTTIRTLLGLIKPTSGSATVLGMDIIKEKNDILRKVGYLSSEAIFYPGMKVREVLNLSAGLRKIECSKETDNLCERLQLDINKKVDELSFGNKKKVGIVCALQHSPELIILDEPTSGLDPLMQKEFFEILKERNKEGKTIFLSSHILSEIQKNCGKAAIIREGQIIACDSVESLSQTNAKRVILRGQIDLSDLSGIRDMNNEEDYYSFLYSGDINDLIHKMAAGNVQDMSISEPDLDEIFLHYYEKGDKENDIV